MPVDVCGFDKTQVIYYDNDDYRIAEFPVGWIETVLPMAPKCREDYDHVPQSFVITLLDTETGERYKAKTWPHYEDYSYFGEPERRTIQIYMISEHYCDCHRKSDAEAGGAVDMDDLCEGDRFLVESLVAESLPEFVLYSETMSLEELE